MEHLPDVTGIARVYDCIAENETGYIINEYLEGTSLKDILDSGKKYGWEEALAVIQPLLAGLGKLHQQGVVHLDIAPENIILTNAGDVKLINFGATKYSTTANSKSLAVILKPGYAPEEQYRSMGEKGPWSDVYALAAVLYHMITGVVPDESVERAMIDNLKTPSELGIKLTKSAENALLNALNVYRENRTQTAERFLQELSSGSVKRVVEKKRKMETGKFPRWAKGLIAGLLCIVVVGTVWLVKTRNQDAGDISSQTVTMIDVIDMDAQTAKQEVEKLGAACRILYIPNKNVTEGAVQAQSIEAGKAFDADTVVDLTASGGESKLTIQEGWVDKKNYEQIEKQIATYRDDANFQCKVTEEKDSSKSNNGYHLISGIKIDDKEVTEEEIQNGDAVLSVNQTLMLYYYPEDEKNYQFEKSDIEVSALKGENIEQVAKIKSVTEAVTLGDMEYKGYVPIPVYGKNYEENKVVDVAEPQASGNNIRISAKNPLKVYYCDKVLSVNRGDDARKFASELTNLGIIADQKEEYSSNPKGTVLEVTWPQKGYVEKGDKLSYTVSKGPKPATPAPQTQKTTTPKSTTQNQANGGGSSSAKTTTKPPTRTEDTNNKGTNGGLDGIG
jgi:beta-lactam-binding protein with PASTA domain